MFIVFDRDRPSDSPFIERVWSCHSVGAGVFSSIASPNLELVFTRLNGTVTVTVRGPETRARQVPCPANGEWLAIRFRAGAFMPWLPARQLLDGNDRNMPQVDQRSFWMEGSAWQVPTFENAESFVAHLARANLIASDPEITATLEGDSRELSDRSIQRRFVRVCGMSLSTLRQIERARRAALLLSRGAAISEAQFEAGFYDQPHLTHSFKRFVGATPAAILRRQQQLSFLYKK